jgi:predicted ATPase
MPFLRSIAPKSSLSDGPMAFPFSFPSFAALDTLELSPTVTFFVGENGSGKSTLLEGIAAAVGLPTVGSESVRDDATLAAQRALARRLRLVWDSARTRDSFFGPRTSSDSRSISRGCARSCRRGSPRSRSSTQAVPRGRAALRRGRRRASLAELEDRYGIDLDANSHGESFLRLFRSRFVPGGLYLLDEPEAPLSPQSQLGLIAMLKEMVTQDAQFIIATHSPMLLAFPNADVYSFDEQPPRCVPFEELEHVRLTRDFLNNPEASFGICNRRPVIAYVGISRRTFALDVAHAQPMARRDVAVQHPRRSNRTIHRYHRCADRRAAARIRSRADA